MRECWLQACMAREYSRTPWTGGASAAESALQLALRLRVWRLKPESATRFLNRGWVQSSQTLQVLLQARVQTDVYHLNAALGAVARAQLWPRGLEMLRGMLLREIADVVSTNSAMHACEKGRWRVAHGLLCLLRTHRGVPTAITYNTCINACSGMEADATAWPWALCLASDMVPGPVSLDHSLKVAFCSSTMLHACQTPRGLQRHTSNLSVRI